MRRSNQLSQSPDLVIVLDSLPNGKGGLKNTPNEFRTCDSDQSPTVQLIQQIWAYHDVGGAKPVEIVATTGASRATDYL